MKPKLKKKSHPKEEISNPPSSDLNDFGPVSKFNDFYRKDEAEVVMLLLDQIQQTPEQSRRIYDLAHSLVEAVRAKKQDRFSIENFLQTYHLNSQEGIVLMCLAEALLRVPDTQTKTRLIRDKIGSVKWGGQPDQGVSVADTLFARLTNFGLSTADHLMNWGLEKKGFLEVVGGLTRRISEPVIRQSIAQAMKILGRQFVMGESIGEAMQRAKSAERQGYRHSYDMLGEAACTKEDAKRYYQSYAQAIESIGKMVTKGDIFSQPSISVKLSALHPRYELAKRQRILDELRPLVLQLALLAKEKGIGLTIDAEESERLDISMDIIQYISAHVDLEGWNGFGVAVQAYQKRAPLLIDDLIQMAKRDDRRLCIRLVKGAYWDSEIKRTQERGLKGYSVFTRKVFTDVCYQVCAQKMFAQSEAVYPQFATHNAQTVAMLLEMAGETKEFELQRLHGMGEALHEQVVKNKNFNVPCRIYAPVGEYRDLLPYLVRRLLENGANTSFVHKIYDPLVSIEALIADPIAQARVAVPIAHPKIPLPQDLFRPQRQNSYGIDLHDVEGIHDLTQKMEATRLAMPKGAPWSACPIIAGKNVRQGETVLLVNPSDNDQMIGQVLNATPEHVEKAMHSANSAFESWSGTDVEIRAHYLERLATLLENHQEELMTLLVYEGGKTLPDALSEVREAVDFCRYYASEARRLMSVPMNFPGPTGELNQLSLQGRGVIVCISPWNFPLAIFIGQVTAALAAGNCVIAKPAHQTPLVAYRAIQLAHEAGIPGDVLHFLPGKGSLLGDKLTRDSHTAGVAFTGSTGVAKGIAQTLLSRENSPIVPLIAETGGMNAMIVDSSALPEQVIQDVIVSSFQSAGQRCSALRMVFVQEEIADNLLAMLKGAMEELAVGNPHLLSTDVGPVIDHDACKQLQTYEKSLKDTAQLICRVALNESHNQGSYFAPQAWELSSATQMTEEVFGPILHVVRFKAQDLDKVINQINATGYGLTLGVHSRIDETIDRVRKRARVGNLYINRSMIGAVVGVQPFGGEGLSGTGPKAGGPNYLQRFTVERSFTQDTTAAGGNATLLADLD
ncbi:MAG: bifunctional proline dehydrogenase/L-glutamate gamma-semialdehyde dehydrogenase PutA [Alphaproteobacteria bacterium]|nr:bifunctional proline dehydrogenase/L-glutamate gamma-semialdehyde dehydrogenase PutA [Alphaproteobacteria bacterium]